MNRGALVKQTTAPTDLADARRQLTDAMNAAEQAGHRIPCKQDPNAFTSDSLLMTGRGILWADQAIQKCLRSCPVIAECRGFLQASIVAGVPLFGVVAGEITSPYHASLARRRLARSSG